MDFFTQVTPQPNELWCRYRDSQTEQAKKIRLLFERMWSRYRDHAESQFLEQFQSNGIYDRWWEMYLYCRLEDLGFKPSQPGEGMPDIHVEWKGKSIYFECISPTSGNEQNKIPDYSSSREAYNVPREQIVLRLTSAIYTKVQQAKKRFDKGLVDSAVKYIIAIDDTQLRYSGFGDYDFYLQSLYGVGHPQVTFNIDTNQVSEVSYQWNPKTVNATGADIPLAPFIEESSYDLISGVLFCNANFGNIGVYGQTPELVICHNFQATNKLSKEFLSSNAIQFFYDGQHSIERAG